MEEVRSLLFASNLLRASGVPTRIQSGEIGAGSSAAKAAASITIDLAGILTFNPYSHAHSARQSAEPEVRASRLSPNGLSTAHKSTTVLPRPHIKTCETETLPIG